MEYRNIANDLVPGRFDKNKRNTAPKTGTFSISEVAA